MKKTILIAAIVSLAALKSIAQPIYVNLNSADTSAGAVDATALLASYGITLSGVSPAGGDPSIVNANIWGVGTVVPDTGNNILIQNASTGSESYTLNFSTPLSELQFTRCAIYGNPPAATPIWSATAYEGATALGSVGATYIDEDTETPAQTYTFTGSGITSLTITGDAENFAAFYSAPLDDFYLTPVPEPTTLALAGISGLSLLLFRRQRKSVG